MLGTRTIAKQLRDAAAAAPSAGSGHPAVHWIISNSTYTGKILSRDRVFDGVHEPLVDELTFQRAPGIRAERWARQTARLPELGVSAVRDASAGR